MAAKIFFPIMLYKIFYIQIKEEKITYLQIKKIIIFNALVLVFNQYLYYFNVGFDNYGISESGILIGGTGFFFAGNEVGATLITLFALLLTLTYRNRFLLNIIIFTIFLGAGIALMSKTAIFGVVLIFVLYLISRYNIYVVSFFLALFIIFFIFYFNDDILNLISTFTNRWSYFYDKYGTIYLFGGIKRWTMIGHILDYSHNHLLSLIIGKGWSGNSENGLFDLFEAYGLFGIFIYTLWFAIVFKLKQKNKVLNFSSNIFIVIMLISFFAGHVIQSAMLSLFAAMLANNNLIVRMKIYENINNK